MLLRFTSDELAAVIGDDVLAASLYERLLNYDYKTLDALRRDGVVKTDVYHCSCGSCDPELVVYLQ